MSVSAEAAAGISIGTFFLGAVLATLLAFLSSLRPKPERCAGTAESATEPGENLQVARSSPTPDDDNDNPFDRRWAGICELLETFKRGGPKRFAELNHLLPSLTVEINQYLCLVLDDDKLSQPSLDVSAFDEAVGEVEDWKTLFGEGACGAMEYFVRRFLFNLIDPDDGDLETTLLPPDMFRLRREILAKPSHDPYVQTYQWVWPFITVELARDSVPLDGLAPSDPRLENINKAELRLRKILGPVYKELDEEKIEKANEKLRQAVVKVASIGLRAMGWELPAQFVWPTEAYWPPHKLHKRTDPSDRFLCDAPSLVTLERYPGLQSSLESQPKAKEDIGTYPVIRSTWHEPSIRGLYMGELDDD